MAHRPAKFALAIVAFLGCLSASPAATDELQVAATIKPVHSLVSGVMFGVGEPALIIRGTTSPHSFSMRPSDARKLANADVIFLIGEAVETSVFQTLDTLASDARMVMLAGADGVVQRPLREGRSFEWSDEHAHHHDGHSPAQGEQGQGDAAEDRTALDMHVWLDPANAAAMAGAIAAALAKADEANAAAYAKVGSVDPLGGAIKSGPELYFTLLRDMAAAFKSCLSP